MKFGEQLSSHLTPEWRKQYIRYEELKSMLYDFLLEASTDPEARSEYISQADETFFAECEQELTKINLFFTQKIAESRGKYHELNAELSAFKEFVGSRQASTSQKRNLRLRFLADANNKIIPTKKLHKEHSKTAQQLKLAFSEFYLNLVLLQNYQQLNATGFRKILKKHDKLMMNDRGLVWRVNHVEKSSFFLNSDIETLISNVEQCVINELEYGDRHAGMKRLKVPPLSEKQNSRITFSLGFFLGTTLVLCAVILLSWYHSYIQSEETAQLKEPRWVAVRLFRGFFLLFSLMLLCGINMYGWAAAGVNHVLIFEVDPRNHLTYQTIMQIAAFMLMLWSLAVLGYQYSHYLHIPPLVFPLMLMIACLTFIFNPVQKPESIFYGSSRLWLLKHCFKCFSAPLHFVTFADFWLGDQMNSLAICFLDLQYFLCFYATEVDYSDGQLHARTLNITESEKVPWGYVDLNTGKDMCISNVWIRSFISVVPAMIRFMQCLRRYRDTRNRHPHLTNAGKYATTFLVVGTNSLTKWYSIEMNDGQPGSLFFYIWIAAYIISFTYNFLWDIFMDWGLIDPRAPKEAPLLREEMIYGSKWYYYLAIVEDFVLRLSWVMNVSLAEAWLWHGDLLMCIIAPLEILRRFIWNYFRLENEHVNNCGQFRAVRDISIKPIRKGDLESLILKMDLPDGVTHRGKDLMERVKKQKKVLREKRQLLKKTRFSRLSLPTLAIHRDSSSFLMETKQ